MKPLFGPYGSSALEYVDRFDRFGVDAIWFHGFNPQAFDTCQKYQISACVEFKTFRVDFNTHPECVPIGVNGSPIRYGDLVQGVCLSQKSFLEETESHLVEGLRVFQPEGIWLDYLTYAGWFETPEPDLQESCFCPDCLADFCNTTGIDVVSPTHILQMYPAQWALHKCRRIAGFARHYANIIRRHLPDCMIGAYMCPWLPDEYDRALTRIFAQDYQLLAPAIDIFTPLIYGKKSGRKPAWGREFLEASVGFVPAGHPVQLILDALDFPECVLSTAESKTSSWGLQLFGGASIFRDPEQAEIFGKAIQRIRLRLAQT